MSDTQAIESEHSTVHSSEWLAITPELLDEADRWLTPERRAALDAMTDEDIAAQIAANPDVAPELDEAWFDKAFAWTTMRRAAGLIDVAPTRAELEAFERDYSRNVRPAFPRAAE